MTTDVVLDTNVLIHAIECEDSEKEISCCHVIYRILDEDNYAIAIDNQYQILEEYKRNISEHENIISTRLAEEIKRHAYESGSEKFINRFPIDESEVSELIQDEFHSEDLIFVRISPKTRSNSIISSDGESICDEDYRKWIEDELGVTVCYPENANDEVFSN